LSIFVIVIFIMAIRPILIFAFVKSFNSEVDKLSSRRFYSTVRLNQF